MHHPGLWVTILSIWGIMVSIGDPRILFTHSAWLKNVYAFRAVANGAILLFFGLLAAILVPIRNFFVRVAKAFYTLGCELVCAALIVWLAWPDIKARIKKFFAPITESDFMKGFCLFLALLFHFPRPE